MAQPPSSRSNASGVYLIIARLPGGTVYLYTGCAVGIGGMIERNEEHIENAWKVKVGKQVSGCKLLYQTMATKDAKTLFHGLASWPNRTILDKKLKHTVNVYEYKANFAGVFDT